jgi:outer membrane protein
VPLRIEVQQFIKISKIKHKAIHQFCITRKIKKMNQLKFKTSPFKIASKVGAMAVLLLVLLTQQSFGQESYSYLTLQQAIKVARENNLALKNAMLDEKISKESTNEVRSQGLPQINANGTFQDYLKIPVVVLPFPNPETGESSSAFPMGRKYNVTGAVEVSQLIYSQSYLVGLKASKTAQQLSALQTRQVQEAVVYDLSVSYYGAQTSAKQLQIAQNNLETINRLIQVTELQQQNGLVKKVDVNKLKVNRTNLETQIQNLQTVNQQQLNVLKFFMGLPISAEISIDTNVQENPELLAAKDQVPSNRTELLLLNKQKELYSLEQKNIAAGYYPTLSVFGQHQVQAMRDEFSFFDSSQPWFPSTIIGARLHVPIFDGLQKRARMQKSKLNFQKTLVSEEQFRQKIDMEMFNAQAQLNNSRAALAAQEENRKLAEEIYAQTQLEYKEGVSSIADLLNAETSMKEAQTNYINAMIQTLIAGLEVKKASGSLLESAE